MTEIELTPEQRRAVQLSTGLDVPVLRGTAVQWTVMAMAASSRRPPRAGHLVVVELTGAQRERLRAETGVEADRLAFDADGRVTYREQWSPGGPGTVLGTVAVAVAGQPAPPGPGVRLLAPPGDADVFGTGGHPATVLAADLLAEHLAAGASVLDVGTGSGVLALVAAELGASSVLAVDVDAGAVAAARRNVAHNGREATVRVQARPPDPSDGPVDLVVANLFPPVLRELAPVLAACLGPGGVLVVSGVVEARWQEVLGELRAAGLLPVRLRERGGWSAGSFARAGEP